MEFKELMDKYENCAGYKIKQKLNNIGITHNIFMQNYVSLENTLVKYEDPDFSIPLNKKDELMEYFKIVNKDLHNFLASVATLIDHTRVVINDLYNPTDSIMEEYKKKIEKYFETDSLASFIKDMRNFTLHKNIPFATAKKSFSQVDGFKSFIALDKNQFLEWKKWSKASKEYLYALDDEFSLLKLVMDYKDKVINFYNWFYLKQEDYHKNEFEELKKLDSEIKKIQDYMNKLGQELLKNINL